MSFSQLLVCGVGKQRCPGTGRDRENASLIEYDADGVWLVGDMSLCDIITSVPCVSPTCVDDMPDDAVKHADRGQSPQGRVGYGASFMSTSTSQASRCPRTPHSARGPQVALQTRSHLASLYRLALSVVNGASCIAEYFGSRRIPSCAAVATRRAPRLYTHTTAYTILKPMTWQRHGPHAEPSPNRAWRSAGCAGTWGPPVGVSMHIQG